MVKNNLLKKIALSTLISCTPIISHSETNSVSPFEYFSQANLSLKEGDLENAHRLYLNAAIVYEQNKEYTNAVRTYALAGTVARKNGDLDSAIDETKTAITLSRKHKVNIPMGEIHDSLGNMLFEKAEEQRK